MSIYNVHVTHKHALAITNCIMILRISMFLFFSTYVMIIWLKYCQYGIKHYPMNKSIYVLINQINFCLLYTSDAADDMQCVDLGGRRIIKKIDLFLAGR